VRHNLDWLPGLAVILAILGLLAWGMRHPGWESRPAPADPVASARLPAAQPLSADDLARVLRDATVQSREVR
jgi:hypothetical protein